MKFIPELNEIKVQSLKPIQYNKEKIEHLTDQLIKLQKAHDSSNAISAKAELTSAMKVINKSLEAALLTWETDNV